MTTPAQLRAYVRTLRSMATDVQGYPSDVRQGFADLSGQIAALAMRASDRDATLRVLASWFRGAGRSGSVAKARARVRRCAGDLEREREEAIAEAVALMGDTEEPGEEE